MATNFSQEGEVLEFTAPTGGVTDGVPVLIGGFFVIPTVTVAATVRFNGWVSGAWSLPKTTGETWTEGQPAYWDSAGLKITTDASLGLPIGAVVIAAASADTTGIVNLNESAVCGRIVVVRKRVAIAAINAAPVTLLNAIPGIKYRLVDAIAIAIGGAAGAVTTVDVLGVLTTSRKLVAFAQASLTQSAVLRAGGTGAAVLADGASYTANDAGTAITASITGASITTATSIDFQVTVALE